MKYCFLVAQCSLIVTLVAIVPGCSQLATQAVEAGKAGGTKAAAEPATSAEPPALVRTEVIAQKIIAPEIRAMGNVRPRRMSIVASGSDGIVEEFKVEVGDFVAKDTLLSQLRTKSARLDIDEQNAVLAEREAELTEIENPRDEDKEEAAARKMSADIAWSTAKRRLEDLEALHKRGAANESELKDAQDTLSAAKESQRGAAAMQSKIAKPRREAVLQVAARLEAQIKHVAFLEEEFEKRSTKAPFAGFVVEEHTNVGQWLSKGDPVVTLAELDEVEVEVQLDQQYIDQVKAGRDVTLHVQGSGNRNGLSRKWPGVVESVVPRSIWQSGSRSFPVIIVIGNEIDETQRTPVPALREGMMAEATFRGEEINAIIVPKDSMVRTSRGTFIFVINPPVEGEPLSVRQVLVEPGLGVDSWIQVTSKDLAAGMQVVTDGAERLRAFQTVVIKNVESDGEIQESVESK